LNVEGLVNGFACDTHGFIIWDVDLTPVCNLLAVQDQILVAGDAGRPIAAQGL
jgi:hypothetical protein